MKNGNTQIHFIDEETDKLILKKIVNFVPRVNDEIRLGGKYGSTFWLVTLVVWIYDEENCPFFRVNIGVKQLNKF